MPGGHVGGVFFSSKVSGYAVRIVDELPSQGYTSEEEQAGFKQINETFGFYATLDTIARYVGQSDKEVLKWSVNEFYNKLKLLSWRAHAQKEYHRIMNSQNNQSNL